MIEYSKTRFEQRDGKSWIRVIDHMPLRHRYLHFGTSIQGVLSLDDAATPVLEYIALMAALGRKLVAEPETLLIGGLGACALWHYARAWRGPRCDIAVVESSELVLELAQRFFRFEPDEGLLPMRLRETLAFEKRDPVALVFIDCYNARFMPAELLSVEFLTILRDRIAEGGVGIVNLWNPKCNKICGHQIRSMLQVFGHVGVIAGKEDDNFAVALPARGCAATCESVCVKGRSYPVTWISAEDPRRWPDYLMATRPIYDGNVWQFMHQLQD